MKILHLYYDIMNLYGEYANITILEKYLNIVCDNILIDKKTIGDEINFEEYDFIYIGSGTEKNQLVVLEDLRKYIMEIKKYIENEKILLATGNSFEIFGDYIEIDEEKIEGLQIFDYNVKRTEDRIADNIMCKFNEMNQEIVGSINKMGVCNNIDNPLFEVIYGIGNNKNSKGEGYRYKNFFGTYVIGPIFVKNPYFLEYVIYKLCNEKIQLSENQIKLYNSTLNELKKLI